MLNSDAASLVAGYCSDTRRAFACVSKDWSHYFSANDAVWKQSLAADFQIQELVGPGTEPKGQCLVLEPKRTYREAWLSWRRFELVLLAKGSERRIVWGGIWLRAIRAFQGIRAELELEDCLRGANLRPGECVVPPKLIERFANQPQTLETIRAIWGTHDGQEPGLRSAGLFGVTQFYNHTRALRMLSMREMSNELNNEFTLVIAKSNTRTPPQREERLCFDPRELQIGNSYQTQARSFNSLVFPIRADVLLVLFETFCKELREEKRTVCMQDGARHLTSFARFGGGELGNWSSITTNGITVTVACKYIPTQHQGRDLFVYQIRISANAQVTVPVMLVSRHWTFVDSLLPDNPEVVEGEGVVGKFPIFHGEARHGEVFPTLGNIRWHSGEFSYQSCTYAHPKSYMQGHFTFAPITPNQTLDLGNAFPVQVGRVSLCLPLFAY
ncbi:hypothetical protein BASA81_010246 [Batrachochytrium salamandrivorans]|nr:hypothetical protein BASA81_010246 [Batrachochytrium salamandrivorans]